MVSEMVIHLPENEAEYNLIITQNSTHLWKLVDAHVACQQHWHQRHKRPRKEAEDAHEDDEVEFGALSEIIIEFTINEVKNNITTQHALVEAG